jgi:hypothetical protein
MTVRANNSNYTSFGIQHCFKFTHKAHADGFMTISDEKLQTTTHRGRFFYPSESMSLSKNFRFATGLIFMALFVEKLSKTYRYIPTWVIIGQK